MANRPISSQTSSNVDMSQSVDIQAPLLRVYTFGAFHLDWQVPPCTTEDLWKSRTSARTLLKLLLCAPGRQASRSQLAGILWPETDEDRARESLRSASKVLRKVLCTARGEELLEQHNQNTILKLAEQSHLWVDADAFEDLISQAGRATTPDEALALWQQAKVLLRGEFLADDQGSEWMRHRWIKQRQQALRMARGRMVRHLADLYLQRGQVSLAEEVLEQHIIRFPTDQDALYRLLLLLERQGCVEEACVLYQRANHLLGAVGKQPAAHVRTYYEQLQQATRTHQQIVPVVQVQPPDPFPEGLQRATTLPHTQAVDVVLPASTVSASFASNQENTLDLVKTHRQMLHDLLMLASTVLVLSPYALWPISDGERASLPLVTTAIDELERMTESFWRLCANTSLDLLGNLVEHFRTIIQLLKQVQARDAVQRLCSLAGEIAQILGKTLFDLHEYTLAWSYYTFSLKAAQAAFNHELWAVGLGRMSLLLIYWNQPREALPLLQEAQQLTVQSPRVACWLAAVKAEVYAHLGDSDACDAALTVARTLASEASLGEDRYATGFNPSRLAGYEGACFVRLRQPDRALPALQQALALLDAQAIRRQSTLFTDMGIAYAQQGNVQTACTFAIQALAITTQTKSLSVLERVRQVRNELESWKDTEDVKDLERHLETTSIRIVM
ncbi:MAG: BTAD domain-containing putative transcriptional regulator [Ktedonobacteraceae bacterium]